jgi:hypothetical protein
MSAPFRNVSWLSLALPLVAAACTRPESAPPAPAASPSVTPLFCAYGGVGLVPDPLPPGYDVQFATAVFDVTHAGAPVAGAAVVEFALLDAAGAVVAAMKRVDHFVELPSAPPPPAPSSNGGWAFYLNPKGTPFGGTLPAGKTRLRVRVALDRAPPEAARFRLKFGGGVAPAVAEGRINGVWGT